MFLVISTKTVFFQYVDKLLQNYTLLFPRRQHSWQGNVRRFFVSPDDQLFPTMVLEAGCVRVWTLLLTTRNDTHAPNTHLFLGRIFLLTPLFINPLFSGVDDWNVPCGQSLSCVYFGRNSWPYLLVRPVLPHPMTSLAAQVSMLFNLGVWMPRGTFRVVTCHRNLCLIA